MNAAEFARSHGDPAAWTVADIEASQNLAATDAEPRFVVRQLGPRGFVIHDNVNQLDYDMFVTRKAAQVATDRRNAAINQTAA